MIRKFLAAALSAALLSTGTAALAQTQGSLAVKDGTGAAQSMCAVASASGSVLVSCQEAYHGGAPISPTNPLNVDSVVRGTATDNGLYFGATFVGAISGTTLTVSSVTGGALAIGQTLTGSNIATGTTITAGSGTSWTVSTSQTVASATLYGASLQQVLIPAGTSVRGYEIQNQTGNYCVINRLGAATFDQHSFQIASGQTRESNPNFVGSSTANAMYINCLAPGAIYERNW